MLRSKLAPMTYKRDKDKVEITGDAKDIKPLVWFDIITSKLPLVATFIGLLVTIPKAIFIPTVYQWLKKKIPFLISFGVVVDLFSG